MVKSKLIHSSHFGNMMSSRLTKGFSRQFSTTIVLIIILATSEFVFGSTVGICYCNHAKKPISVPSSFEDCHVPRGGGISLRKSENAKGSVYLKALDDEIISLKQKLRCVEQEKRSLKYRMSKRQQIQQNSLERSNDSRKERPGKGKRLLEKQDEDLLLLANLEQLDKQKASLLTATDQLEAIKTDFNKKLNALLSELSSLTTNRKTIEKTFLARVKELEKSVRKVREKAASPKIYDDPDLSRKIKEACRTAITEFWVEGNRKLEDHERQLKARQEQDLLEERRLATLAVEKQQQKMRALARAMAIREKEVASKTKSVSLQLNQEQPKMTDIHRYSPKRKSSSDMNRNEMLKREKLKAIREDAERKAKEEEARMWLELENELERERERLQRMKQRQKEERRRCEQEELERRRLLQQHALDMQERLKQEQKNAALIEIGKSSDDSFFGKLFSARKKEVKTPKIMEPSVVSIENYQRRVVWQPIFLPPKEAVRITGPSLGK